MLQRSEEGLGPWSVRSRPGHLGGPETALEMKSGERARGEPQGLEKKSERELQGEVEAVMDGENGKTMREEELDGLGFMRQLVPRETQGPAVPGAGDSEEGCPGAGGGCHLVAQGGSNEEVQAGGGDGQDDEAAARIAPEPRDSGDRAEEAEAG